MGKDKEAEVKVHDGLCKPPYSQLLMLPERPWWCECGRGFAVVAVPYRNREVSVWIEISKEFEANTVFYRE